ncbi:SAM-dependent methyltransferase, partial [Bacillus pumilus]
AKRSVAYNQLEKQRGLIHGDRNDMPARYGNHKVDVITCNPPYFKTPSKEEINENEYLATARHEIHGTLEDVIRVS